VQTLVQVTNLEGAPLPEEEIQFRLNAGTSEDGGSIVDGHGIEGSAAGG